MPKFSISFPAKEAVYRIIIPVSGHNDEDSPSKACPPTVTIALLKSHLEPFCGIPVTDQEICYESDSGAVGARSGVPLEDFQKVCDLTHAQISSLFLRRVDQQYFDAQAMEQLESIEADFAGKLHGIRFLARTDGAAASTAISSLNAQLQRVLKLTETPAIVQHASRLIAQVAFLQKFCERGSLYEPLIAQHPGSLRACDPTVAQFADAAVLFQAVSHLDRSDLAATQSVKSLAEQLVAQWSAHATPESKALTEAVRRLSIL